MYKITNKRTGAVVKKECLLDTLIWVEGYCYREDDEFLVEGDGQSIKATVEETEWKQALVEKVCQSCGKDPFDCVPN